MFTLSRGHAAAVAAFRLDGAEESAWTVLTGLTVRCRAVAHAACGHATEWMVTLTAVFVLVAGGTGLTGARIGGWWCGLAGTRALDETWLAHADQALQHTLATAAVIVVVQACTCEDRKAHARDAHALQGDGMLAVTHDLVGTAYIVNPSVF
mgnify:CR=1 FL=1